jgi:glycosyltransferase involved in cell wall biosynthesis
MTVKALKSATAFCSMSKSYLEWMSNLSNRALDNRDIITPLTTSDPEISLEEIVSAQQWWEEKGVPLKTKRRMHFIGSLSPSFDFSIIKRVAERFEKKGINCQFVICGDGSETEKVRGMMSGLKNVIMPGWIDAGKAKVLCDSSSASLAPYINTDNFRMNVPNKILDSLQKGLPIITTLEGEVKELVEVYNSGFSSTNEDEIEACILSLLNDEELRISMSKNAKNLYSQKFSLHKVYNKLTSHLEDLAKDA